MITDLEGIRPTCRSGWSRPIRPVWALGLTGLASLAVTVSAFGGLGRVIANEDHALLWVASRDWAAWSVPQPTFYGQFYGSTLEAAPTALLTAVGLGPADGLAITIAVASLASWIVLAAAVYRRGYPGLAAAAASLPILLRPDYVIYVTYYTPAIGRAMGVFATALLLVHEPRRWAWAAFAALAGLAALLEVSTLLLTAPACVYLLLSGRVPTRARLVPIGLGAIVPVGALVAVSNFNRNHPDYGLHQSSTLAPSWSRLIDHLELIGPTTDLFSPAIAPFAWSAAVVLAGLVVAAASSRRTHAVAAALTFVLVLAAGMATTAPLNGIDDWYYPADRAFMSLPFAAVLLAMIVGETKHQSDRLLGAATAGLAVVLAGSLVVQAITLPGRLTESINSAASSIQISNRLNVALERDCRDFGIVVQRQRAELLVSPDDRILAYGCEAIAGFRTLVANYERRTWRLYEESEGSDTRFLLAGPTQGCEDRPGVTCTPVRTVPELVLVEATTDTISALESLGVPVRAFGPGCRPDQQDPFSCVGSP
jgi:hypothetical protein